MPSYKVTRLSNGMEWVLPTRSAVGKELSVSEKEFDLVDKGVFLHFGGWTVERVVPTALYVMTGQGESDKSRVVCVEACSPGEALRMFVDKLGQGPACGDQLDGGKAFDVESFRAMQFDLEGRASDHRGGTDVTDDAIAEYEAAMSIHADVEPQPAPSPSM